MNIGIALEIDSSLEGISTVIAEVATRIKDFFTDRSYGEDLTNIFIGVILTGPGSENLHPIRKPVFKKLLRFKNRIINRVMEFKNVFQYDVKPDYEAFASLTAEQARVQLCEELLASMEILDVHKSEFPDFDLERFRHDFRVCISSLA